MRIPVAIAAFFPLLLSSAAFAQVLDCRILLHAANTAQHEGEIVVAPGTPVTLEIHCDGDVQPQYLWSTGASTFSIGVNSSGNPGAQQGYNANVSFNGQSQQLFAIVRNAVAAAPACTLTRDPAGTARVFTTVTITADCPGATSYQWTGGYDLRGQGSSSVIHVNVVNDPNALQVPIDVVGSNASGEGPVAGVTLSYTLAPPSCRIVTTPQGTIAPLAAVTLTAECDGAPTSYRWSNGATGSSMTVNLASTTGYSVTATNAAGDSMVADHVVGVSGEVATLRNYTGHWWGEQFENGWGMTLNQHGQTIFGVIYFYDATGEPTWAVMPSGSWNSNYTAYTGELFSPQGAPFTNYDASQLAITGPVGSMTLTFTSPTAATASYKLGYSQFDTSGRPIMTYGQKSITPLILNSGVNPSGINVADMWWGGASQNGWGISINQRSSEIFSAWFTYGADRRPTWFIVSGSTWSGNTAQTSIFRVTGAPWLGVPYDRSRVLSTKVGEASLAFANDAQGTFNYNVNLQSGSKAISRQGF